MRARPLPAFALLAALLLLAAPRAVAAESAPERPQIYKWVDEHGIAHYTTDRKRIPREIRQRVQSLGGAAPDVAAAPPPSAGPAETPLVGPPPERPDHPEAWVSRNAPPHPTEAELLALEEAERSEAVIALDQEIAGLEGEIAAREEQLLVLLDTRSGESIRDDPALRELAEELPTLQADLEALRQRRVELVDP